MLVEDPRQRETAYAMVSIVFEMAVVTAPALVAAIVAVSSPQVAVLAAAALGSGASTAFTVTPASRRWRGTPHQVGWLGPLGAAGMRTVFGVLVAFGTAVGIVQVAVPAFAADRGSAAAGGVLLAALSAGSLVGGLVYGARSWPGAQPRRLAALLVGLGAGFALLAVADTEVALAALLVLSGLLLAPTTVVGSTLLDTVAPSGTVTEAFTVMVMAIVVGTAVGNAVGGAIVESASYETAVLWAGVAAVAGAALTLVRRRTLA
jgi:MFS family permease